MKIFIICSKHFYDRIGKIKDSLENKGHEITTPNSYDEPFKEFIMKEKSVKAHQKWKESMMKLHEPKVRANDAILVLNLEKKGIPNYIGGGTFMEIIKAWELNKKIFFYNPLPKCCFTNELEGINPKVINKNLNLIK